MSPPVLDAQDRKVRDDLSVLRPRVVLGAFTTGRVGARAWSRPNVAISKRIFLRYRVRDPWDPDSVEQPESIGLGPVSLRFSETRRQPAPHAKPRAPAKPSGAGHNAHTKDLPRAPRAPVTRSEAQARASKAPAARPTSSPPLRPRAPKPTRSAPPAADEPLTDLQREFGGPIRHKVAKVPIRPELAAQLAAEAAAEAGSAAPRPAPPPPAAPHRPPPVAHAPPPRAPPPSARPVHDPTRTRKARMTPEERAAVSAQADGGPKRELPPIPKSPPTKRGRRLSLRSTKAVSPVARSVPVHTDIAAVTEAQATKAAAPVPKSTPVEHTLRGTGGGLDDLFGMALNEGRMRIGKPKDKT